MANAPPSPDTRARTFTLNIEQLQLDVQHRWLRACQVAEILWNHHLFHFSTQLPDKPPSGSLFLYNRKVVSNFRIDGHIWKRKDGKLVSQGHKRYKLQVGGDNVLHSYYSTAEENPCFKRRAYWLQEEKFRDIIFVHYLEIKDRRSTSDKPLSVISNSQLCNSLLSSGSISHYGAYAGNNVFPNTTRTLTSTYEDIESDLRCEECKLPPIAAENVFNNKQPITAAEMDCQTSCTTAQTTRRVKKKMK